VRSDLLVSQSRSYASSEIIILSDLSVERSLDYINGPTLTDSINIELARIWSVLQEHDRDTSRSLRTFATSEPVSLSVGTVAVYGVSGFEEGPTASEISAAGTYAAAAAASADEAEEFAILSAASSGQLVSSLPTVASFDTYMGSFDVFTSGAIVRAGKVDYQKVSVSTSADGWLPVHLDDTQAYLADKQGGVLNKHLAGMAAGTVKVSPRYFRGMPEDVTFATFSTRQGFSYPASPDRWSGEVVFPAEGSNGALQFKYGDIEVDGSSYYEIDYDEPFADQTIFVTLAPHGTFDANVTFSWKFNSIDETGFRVQILQRTGSGLPQLATGGLNFGWKAEGI